MILSSLVQYYEALAERGLIAKPGWNPAKISFSLNLNREGKLVSVSYLCKEEMRGKKMALVPREMSLPSPVKRSSGVNANFLWDNSAYLLGVDEKGNPKRAKDSFEASKKKHEDVLGESEDETARAILKFFCDWVPEKASEEPLLQEYWQEIVGGANLTFKVDGLFVGESEEIRHAWQRYMERASELDGVCLVTGQRGAIARLHPSVKGVPGLSQVVRRWSLSMRTLIAPMEKSKGVMHRLVSMQRLLIPVR